MLLCEYTEPFDCEPRCPGCVLSSGGEWNGSKWVYPEAEQARIDAQRKLRADLDGVPF